MTTYRWSFDEDVAAYRRAGIDAIGVWRSKLSQFGEEQGVELILDSGLSVSSLSWAGGFTGINGHSFSQSLDDACDALELAAALRADCLVIVSGSRGIHTGNHARRLLIDALNVLVEPAAELGVELAVQPVHPDLAGQWSFLSSLDETLEVIDRCRHEAVKLVFNVYHLWHEQRLMERIPEIAPVTSLVQLSDWREPAASENDRCLPGQGDIPLDEIVAAFTDSGYAGLFELEIWSEELWNSDYQPILKSCRSLFNSLCPQQTIARRAPGSQ